MVDETMNGGELAIMLSFLLFIFWIGIAPAAYFALMDSTVAQMVTNIVSSGALAMP